MMDHTYTLLVVLQGKQHDMVIYEADKSTWAFDDLDTFLFHLN